MMDRFQRKLADFSLLDSEKHLLLAVSGGVDSVVLVDLLAKLPAEKRPELSIAHVNHHLRAVSDAEEAFVKDLAEDYGLSFYSHQWGKEKQAHSGIEKAAREERYSFFKKVMNEEAIPYLMTGHHLDDQTETILMRLTRGASAEQLLGIREQQDFPLENGEGYLIRPLLDYSKEEIYEYAKEHELLYVEDESNQGLDYTRNRFRNQIIPLLKEENVQFNEHIQQFRKDLADLIKISRGPINRVYKKLTSEIDEEFHLDVIRFKDYSVAMQEAVIQDILKKLYKDEERQYKTNYIELINHWLLQGEVNSSLDLTGDFLVEKKYEEACFKKKELAVESEKEQTFEINELNQWIQLSENEKIGLFLSDQTPGKMKEEASKIRCLKIEKGKVDGPLKIRQRKAGDRMTYKGLKGHKKIKDIFIDEKVPKKEREKAWLVEDSQGQIIWLISYRKMDLFPNLRTDKIFYKLIYIKK